MRCKKFQKTKFFFDLVTYLDQIGLGRENLITWNNGLESLWTVTWSCNQRYVKTIGYLYHRSRFKFKEVTFIGFETDEETIQSVK